MPDIIPTPPAEPVDQTNPFDAGHTTTEWSATKWVTICAGIVAVLGGITETLTQMGTVLPNVKWIGVALTIVGMISAVAAQIGYALSRGNVKVKMLDQGVKPRDVGTATGNLNAS